MAFRVASVENLLAGAYKYIYKHEKSSLYLIVHQRSKQRLICLFLIFIFSILYFSIRPKQILAVKDPIKESSILFNY